jgi:tetratricopeptide (TPR) repeat protein
MTHTIGTRLGPYDVLAPLGAGGMGEVYRARDSKLNREVALKVLPQAAATDPERLARFKREAQVLASLNHPHIAAIYGFEDSGPVHALVLELVEGPTLADRIAEGPLPLALSLSIACQIAEALEAAAEQGVIHRDLKPANIKLRPDGAVKVLDFGLAKLVQSGDSHAGTVDPAVVPTIASLSSTRVGTIMGTPAYMSPEQARGRPVGKQADIWAFGCVLFEMLARRPAFAGETTTDTIARVIEREPDWSALPSSTPPAIRELLRRCLHKEPSHRLHDVADARIEIEEARTRLTGRHGRLWRMAAGAVFVLAVAAGAAVWYRWRAPAPAESVAGVEREPVSVLIADLRNDTGDAVFDRTIEPVLRLVLEGAPFVSAYDRSAVGRSLGVRPPDVLDEAAAREIAVKQGVGVVLSGVVGRRGAGFSVSVEARQSVTGETIANASGEAPTRDRVLAAATDVATRIRIALGDERSESARRFAADTLSATSLDAVHEYALAMDALSRSRFADALQAFSRAVAVDPAFGMAFGGMAIASRNLDRQQDAEKYITEAMRHVDSMTERERYRTRGLFAYLTGDYQRCVAEYEEMLAGYPADVAARNNHALCLTYLRDLPRALEEMRRVVEILPNRSLYRVNLSLYASYSGDFDTGEREARAVQDQTPWGIQALALALSGKGQTAEAVAAYQRLANVDQLGSYGTSGLGDLASYEGRWSEAARIYRQGADADLKTGDNDRAAAKLVALADNEIRRQQEAAAIAAADRALGISQTVKIRFLAARVLAEAGRTAQASDLAAGLSSALHAEPRAYGSIVAGMVALQRGDHRGAIQSFAEANGLLDTWIGHFDLGRAYLEAGAFVQADSEFDRCLRRRGEALSLFLDEEPTAAALPPVYYYQGLAREGLKAEGADAAYRRYLDIRGQSSEDALVGDVKRRIGRTR